MPGSGTPCLTSLSLSRDGKLLAGSLRDAVNARWSVVLWDTHLLAIARNLNLPDGLTVSAGVPGHPLVLVSPDGKCAASRRGVHREVVLSRLPAHLVDRDDGGLLEAGTATSMTATSKDRRLQRAP